MLTDPLAAQLGLLDDDPRGASPAQMIQGLSRFLLDEFVKNYHLSAPSNEIERAFQTNATNSIRCMNCRSESTRPSPTNVNELIYPSIVSSLYMVQAR